MSVPHTVVVYVVLEWTEAGDAVPDCVFTSWEAAQAYASLDDMRRVYGAELCGQLPCP